MSPWCIKITLVITKHRSSHILPIGLGEDKPEVGRLEQRRKYILQGMLDGFAETYDVLKYACKDVRKHSTSGMDAAMEWYETLPKMHDEDTYLT